MDDTDHFDTYSQILDTNVNDYIDKEKLQRLCPHLSTSEIDTIFNEFDEDHDDRICLKELLQANACSPELNQQTAIDRQSNLEETMIHAQINEALNNLTCQEQIYDFYETLRNGSNDSTEQFQSILEVFVSDILKYRKEIKRLEDSYKREKETNENYLRNIEEDQERDMRQLEDKIRQEECHKYDVERELLERQNSKEINDLHSTIQRLQALEQIHMDRRNEEDSSAISLHEEIAKLSEENRTLNASLTDSLTANAIVQSDLQSYKAQLNDRQAILLQEKHSSSSNHREKEALQTNVRHLIEVNKQLRDENDTLRACIESKSSPIENYLPSPRRAPSTVGSTLGSYWNNSSLDSPSPSYIATANPGTLDSFDLDSTDEKAKRALTSGLMAGLDTVVDRNNTTTGDIDSGLSLATARDPTEVESGGELNASTEPLARDVKQLRPLITKQDRADTDSDDVFVEISLDRLHPKRSSQRKTLKRTINNESSTSKQLVNSSLGIPQPLSSKRTNVSQVSGVEPDIPFDRMFKVVFCGDAAVGKSALVMRLCKGKFESSAHSTLGVDFQSKQCTVDGHRVAVQLWDTAGQERFRSIAKSYFRRCDGVILVYDATYERSFLNVREWINTIVDATPKKVSVMIVGNKIDLRDRMRAEGKRVIEQTEGVKLAKEYKALFIETSAKDGTNSDEALIELARDMRCNEDLERFHVTGVDLDKDGKKSNCCNT